MNDINQYIEQIGNLNSPVYISVFVLLLLISIVFLFVKVVVIPLNAKHADERRKLELQTAQMMALFAELDPDPILRADKEGKIIHYNSSAEELFGKELLINGSIKNVLQDFNEDLTEIIDQNREAEVSIETAGKYFSVLIKGVANLDIAQVYFHDLTKRKEFETKLLQTTEKLRELYRYIHKEQEKERSRIARELHDVIGQNLLLVQMNIAENPNSKKLIESAHLLDATVKNLREIIYDLKPRILEESGLEDAVRALCKSISEKFYIESSIDIQIDDPIIDENIKINLYRIIQEALSNIAKHSRASEFILQLRVKGDDILLTITDDGNGFDPNYISKGMGLLNISERVESLKGSFNIQSEKESGTRLIIKI